MRHGSEHPVQFLEAPGQFLFEAVRSLFVASLCSILTSALLAEMRHRELGMHRCKRAAGGRKRAERLRLQAGQRRILEAMRYLEGMRYSSDAVRRYALATVRCEPSLSHS
jgi:hypothetical protein